MKQFFTQFKIKYQQFRTSYPKLSLVALAASALTLVGVLAVGVFLTSVSAGAFGDLPTEAELRNIENAKASEIYSADGELLGRYYRENRTFCKLEDMPDYLLKALVAVEDSRFYDHDGIDYQAWGRVAYKTLLLGQDDQGGGSTLSQQLVKNTFPRQDLGYGPTADLALNKLKESFTARRLEDIYSKEEILELYLNTVAFSDNTYGVAAAARRYWQKEPKDLTLEECAALVAMLKATSSYCPLRNPEANKQRRELIMSLMAEQGYLKEDTDTTTFALNYYRPDGYAGPVPHFRETARKSLNDILANTQRPDGRPYNLETDGLRVYTTLNLRAQKLAEAAVEEEMTDLQEKFDKHLYRGEYPWTSPVVVYEAMRGNKAYRAALENGADTVQAAAIGEPRKLKLPSLYGDKVELEGTALDSLVHVLGTLRAGFLVTDHTEGTVVAWVGGGNPYFSAYDNITSRHQTGSSFKPILYAAGLNAGVDPCRRYDNELVSYAEYDGWTPGNSNHEYGGRYSLHGGLQSSVNTVAVKLIMDIGPQTVTELAAKIGLPDVLPVPSTALGTHEASVQQMVAAYSTFADGGYYTAPRFIERIEDGNGKVIYQAERERTKVMDYEAALTTLDMLRGVVDGGTGWRLRGLHGLKGELAGKTGTTQDAGDGWFIGLTPKLIGGAWVGGDTPAVRFHRGSHGNGSRTALPIWGTFLEKVTEDEQLSHYVEGSFPKMYKNGFPCSAYEADDDWIIRPDGTFEEVPIIQTSEAR